MPENIEGTKIGIEEQSRKIKNQEKKKGGLKEPQSWKERG